MPYHRNPMIKLLYNSIFKHKVLPSKKKYDRKKEKYKVCLYLKKLTKS